MKIAGLLSTTEIEQLQKVESLFLVKQWELF